MKNICPQGQPVFLSSGYIIKCSLFLPGAWAPDVESSSNRDCVWSVRGIWAEAQGTVWAGCGKTPTGNSSVNCLSFFVKIHTLLLWFELESMWVSESLSCYTLDLSPFLWPEFHCTLMMSQSTKLAILKPWQKMVHSNVKRATWIIYIFGSAWLGI